MLGVIWFVLIGVLFAGYAIFDGFDLGVGTLYPLLGKTDEDRRILRKSIGPIWDGNEVWLLTAGGALFAAFPPVYATVFSGFYLALMLVLFSLIFRAAALEFRSYDPQWATLWDWSLVIGSAVPSLLFGVAVGNIIRGVPLDDATEFAGTFFTLLNPYALIIGVTGLAWILMHGTMWLGMKTVGDLYERVVSYRRVLVVAFGVMFVVASVATALLVPEAFLAVTGNPLGWIFVAVTIASIGFAWFATRSGADRGAFYGSVLAATGMVGIWAVSIFPALVPSLGPGPALTIDNAASSPLTLTVMLLIAGVGVPLVLFYFFLIYRTYAGRIEPATLDDDSHY